MSEIKQQIIDALSKVEREGITDLIKYLTDKTDFFTAPASTKYHSNYEGGLADHSWLVREIFARKNEQYNLGLSEDTITICAIGHDFCKFNFYTKGKKNVKEGKLPNGRDNWVEKDVWDIEDKLPLSHGHKSIIILQRFIPLSEFEVLAIAWHMGVPEDYEMKQAYNKAVEKYPAIVTLHTSDIESSYLLEKVMK